MGGKLLSHWVRLTPISVALLPVAGVFRLAAGLRRWAYMRGLLASFAVDVPVWVVGNITAGGSGKTPMVIWLVNWLIQQGLNPGVVSRGYGGHAKGCVELAEDSAVDLVGDEPLLIYLKTRVPVVVGRDRVAAARTLLQHHPQVNILLSDDGLQHYRLRRQLELVVVDAGSGFGNGLPLPAGPLREPMARLQTVDALIQVNRGEPAGATQSPANYQANFTLGQAYSLKARQQRVNLADLPRSPWLAITGIGNPQGFFAMLEQLGWTFTRKVFPDHHPFQAADIPLKTRVVMTEKDAVKCSIFAQPDWWAVELEVQPEARFIEFLHRKIALFYPGVRQVAKTHAPSGNKTQADQSHY